MSRPAWLSGREALAASAVAILLGGLVLMSLVVERDVKTPTPASAAAVGVGGRRMAIGAVQDLRDGDDPLSSSKRKVPNGPDPIHNRKHVRGQCIKGGGWIDNS
ncbi:hypothetical protein SORBI_3002G068500 [Sorghum bicolor]|uniref:Uncharacterized protein n=1 Tax=Sorghum bicolor TaxID=4558 RepID=A0A1W0W2N9_SORBI|nr:hypothetical protein SORBI_3002G068500 [Sorghum bicolor]